MVKLDKFRNLVQDVVESPLQTKYEKRRKKTSGFAPSWSNAGCSCDTFPSVGGKGGQEPSELPFPQRHHPEHSLPQLLAYPLRDITAQRLLIQTRWLAGGYELVKDKLLGSLKDQQNKITWLVLYRRCDWRNWFHLALKTAVFGNNSLYFVMLA